MGPGLVLPSKYRFKFFASTRNAGAISDYLPPPLSPTWKRSLNALDGGASSSKASSNDVCVEVINLRDDPIEKKGPAKKKKKQQDPADVIGRW
jgi:hypothetical protein